MTRGAVLRLLLIGLLAGCGDSAQVSRDDGVVRLWKASHGETAQDFERLLQPFLSQYPDKRLEAVAHPWQGWDERYATAYTGGVVPDVAYMPDEFWPRFAAAGKLAPLDEWFPDDIATLRAQYPDNLWQLGSMNGHQYGIPYVYVSWHLLYNKQLFDEAGVAYPPATPDAEGFDDWTWDVFADVGRRLTRDTDGDGRVDQWGLAWTALDENPNSVYPFLWQGGADLLDADRQGNGFAERGVVGLRFLQRLVQEGTIPEQGMHPTPGELFYDGQAAMMITAGSSLRVLRRDFPELPVGAAIVPRGPAGDFYEGRGAFGNAGFWVVSRDTPDRQVAFDLAKALTSAQVSAQMMQIIGLFSARLDWEAPGEDELRRTFLNGRRYLVPYPLHPRLRLVHSIILAELQAMLLDHKTPSEAVADAADAVDDLVALR